jgi:hypothetical protein
MALVPVRVSPAESARERGPLPAGPDLRQADHRFAGLVPVTFIRVQRPAGRSAWCIRQPPRRGARADL